MNPSSSGTEGTRHGSSATETAAPETNSPGQHAGPLAEHTTLRLGGPATRLVVAEHPDDLADVVRTADAEGARLLVLGGGSNLVVADSGFDGLAVRIATRGRWFDSLGDGVVQLTAEAGEDWDAVVAETVRQGLGGVECLSGIPGLTGATPVQNVGAYGLEMSELLSSVDLLDRRTGRVRTVPAGDLGLTYRDSVLKRSEDAVVLRVRLLLRDGGLSAPIRYAELARRLGVEPGERVDARRVRETVLALRRGKGMVLDPADHDTWSAGSFFTNPMLSAGELAAFRERLGQEETFPSYPAADGRTKLSAAWLIEHAGFAKGHVGPGGRVSLSTKHTLALTNRGAATTRDLLDLAREVRDGVRIAFGVSLAPEPVLIDCSLDA